VNYPYPVEPHLTRLDKVASSTSLYQSTLPRSGAIGGQSASPWLLATSTRKIGRVRSPCGASVYRRSFPTRHVRGQHGRPARSTMFPGCGPCRPVSYVNARPEGEAPKLLRAPGVSALCPSKGLGRRMRFGPRARLSQCRHTLTTCNFIQCSGNALEVSDERLTADRSMVVFARESWDNS
jgi:hypothetical protein